MSTTAGDLRYALRSMRAHPGFTAVAVASIALGIGVNSTVFSLVDQLLLWSVPARDPARLMNVTGGRSMAYPFFLEYRNRNQVFSGMFASSFPQPCGLRPEGAAAVEAGRVTYVTGGYFSTLGAGVAAGRVITDADDQKPGGSPVAVLSYNYWQTRLGRDLNVLGRKLLINGQPFEIIGIAEKGFAGLFKTQLTDAFVPVTMYPVTNPAAARAWNTPNMHWLFTMGRLKPGMSREQAQAGMRVLWPQAAEAVNDSVVKSGGRRRTYDKEEQIVLKPGARGASQGGNDMLDPLKALTVATALVLLIACANVANLLLARSTSRRRELAIRVAMGANRTRLIRQLLTESLLTAVLGGAIGLALAWWGVLALAQAGIVNTEMRFHPNAIVLAYTAGITVLTGILFGIAPAVRGTRIGLTDAIRDGGSATQSGSRLRLGKVLIAAQVTLSVALLVGAGLFIRTLRNLQNVDIGFQREDIVIVDIDPTPLGYQGHRVRTFYDELLERTRRISGVRAAGLASMTPMGEYMRSRTFSAEGYQPKPGERLVALWNPVSSGYFTTLGIPMLLGRDFRPQDEPAVTPSGGFMAALGRSSGGSNDLGTSASRVCVLNESMARRLFGSSSPVGRHISYDDRYTVEGALEVVGVVKDVHHMDVRTADREGIIYVPTWGEGAEARWLGVRVGGDAAPVIAAIRREVRALDPNVPVLRTRKLEEYVNSSLRRERLIAYLSGFFGALALVLAAVGLYGVMAYAVTQRTKEVGIRMALGAQRADVVRMVVRESLLPVVAGIAVGTGAALALTQLITGMLYGVAPRDPLSIAVAALAMLAVAAIAAALPARRASRVDPMVALHYE